MSVLLLSVMMGVSLPAHAGDGWPWLNYILNKLSPSVNTHIPLSEDETAKQITLYLKLKNYDAALSTAQKAYDESHQKNIQFYFLIGEALRGLGQWQKAAFIFKDMTQRYPELPEPWNSLAMIQMHFQKWNDALYSLQMALLADPQFAPAQDNLEIVSRKIQPLKAP